MSGTGADLDDVFVEIGEVGRSQIITLVLLSVLNILSGTAVTNYMISAGTLDYRCKVPECEAGNNNRELPFNQTWINDAIPFENGKPDKCHRYAPKVWTSALNDPGQCSADMFDTSKKIECTEYVYSSNEINLQTEFNIHCKDEYKLALIGTMGNVARFTFLPITGLISDKFGRLPGIVMGSQLAFIIALVKSFSVNYTMYVMCEFLEAAAFTFCFTGVYCFAIEQLSKRYRVLGNTIMSIAFALGEMILGIVAMYEHEYRDLVRIFCIPGLLIFLYFWIVPESVRWLLATGRIDRAINTLKSIVKLNRRQLSDKSIEMIQLQYSNQNVNSNEKQSTEKDSKEVEAPSVVQSLILVFKSRTLRLRFLSCCYQFAACAFCYFGLGQSSTNIAGANRYISFIIVMGIEIPANILVQVLLETFQMRRKVVLFTMYVLAAISVIATSTIPKEYSWAVLLCFVVGKGAVTIAFTGLYMHVAEIWPTSIRNTIMNTCSMIGRVGSMVAPFVVVLGAHAGSLPALLFAGSTALAAVAILINPETLGKKLPDTITEAEQL